MKTTIGGDRLGSGNKQEISLRNYERSTHDLSSLWRSSMASGTLVPFMSLVALPGDTFDIDLQCEVLTLPTVGPLFGSFKVQLDVFQVPIRLYNASLHMNRLGIGMDMSKVYLPQLEVKAIRKGETEEELNKNLDDNSQINPSCILSYLGIRGIGTIVEDRTATREFNAIPYLAYWEIYKNYYANKQEERGYVIHYDHNIATEDQKISQAVMYTETAFGDINNNRGSILDVDNSILIDNMDIKLEIVFGVDAEEPSYENIFIDVTIGADPLTTYRLDELFDTTEWDEHRKVLWVSGAKSPLRPMTQETAIFNLPNQSPMPINFVQRPILQEFPLDNIDQTRLQILRKVEDSPYVLNGSSLSPYQYLSQEAIPDPQNINTVYSTEIGQEGLGLKTYQSDLFNNWIDTEWIDGTNGVNEVTSVSTEGDSFTIDALNLSQKVYNMLNRIAISGGTYDDWLDAVYTHERHRGTENPVYMGSLIKELAFEEVISNAEAGTEGTEQPLGTLAGRGRLTQKNKGGKIKIKIDEPSYIMGIVSITPRIDYSQGNTWDVNLKTMNDFHKPALDAIGYQDLITEQMAWQSTHLFSNAGEITTTTRSAGKQPAWINYMTDVNRTYGNFAIQNKEMFMTLNRRYEINNEQTLEIGAIKDLTTYIDPSKFNHIFAQTSLDAQNFWVQISKDITARRKMSAKVIPNL